jgi:hypothetical protein
MPAYASLRKSRECTRARASLLFTRRQPRKFLPSALPDACLVCRIDQPPPRRALCDSSLNRAADQRIHPGLTWHFQPRLRAPFLPSWRFASFFQKRWAELIIRCRDHRRSPIDSMVSSIPMHVRFLDYKWRYEPFLSSGFKLIISWYDRFNIFRSYIVFPNRLSLEMSMRTCGIIAES